MEPVTATELGEWLGISARAASLEKRGIAIKVTPGRYDLKASVQRHAEDIRKEARSGSGTQADARHQARAERVSP
jgi:hypothetical protein